MSESSNHLYQFGLFQLEPAERRLLRAGEPVPLTPKAFDTLVILVEHAGHLVEKEDLMKALWPDSFVEEANLAQHIWTLRKTLGETHDKGQFIETVARKGFRFVAPVIRHQINETAAANAYDNLPTTGVPVNHIGTSRAPDRISSSASPLLSKPRVLILILIAVAIGLAGYGFLSRKAVDPNVPAKNERPAGQVKTIAVLPFKPLSADSRNESLEMGMTETLITHLSNLRQLSVRPMGAVRKYLDPHQDPIKVGQELQVDAVLDGSIQKAGDRVRVTVRLTNVQNGTALWAQQFDEKFTNIFSVQDSIAQRVANTLPLKLDGGEQDRLTRRYTDSAEAYQLYLQAQYLWDNRTAENRRKMFQYYQQAIEHDPKFALAYVGMADLQITLVGDNQLAYKEVQAQIAGNLAKALELDPELAQARNLLAEVKYQFDFDWSGAEKEFKRAIDLNPNVAKIRLAYSWYLMSLGRFDEATVEMDRAQELDLHSMVINRAKGRLYYFMHQFDRSIQHLQRIADAEPGNPTNHWALARAYEAKGQYAEAVEENAKAAQGSGGEPNKIAADKETFIASGWQAYLERRKGILMKHIGEGGYVSAMIMATVNAKLGNKDEAFTWLNKAIDDRASGIPNLKVEPAFDPLHSDPRFGKLLQRMNLTP